MECEFISVSTYELYVGPSGLNNPGFSSRQVQEIFLFSEISTLGLGPTHPFIQWVMGLISLVAKGL
jgi:hypothetical protein